MHLIKGIKMCFRRNQWLSGHLFLLVLHAHGTEKLLCCRIRDPDSVSGQRFCNEGEVLSSKLSAGCSPKETE